jgi:hypothetical protein
MPIQRRVFTSTPIFTVDNAQPRRSLARDSRQATKEEDRGVRRTACNTKTQLFTDLMRLISTVWPVTANLFIRLRGQPKPLAQSLLRLFQFRRMIGLATRGFPDITRHPINGKVSKMPSAVVLCPIDRHYPKRREVRIRFDRQDQAWQFVSMFMH